MDDARALAGRLREAANRLEADNTDDMGMAEAVTEKVAHFTERVHAQCERDEARRALADATKRIEALEAGLVDADRDRTYWHRKWRALSPASGGKTDG